MSVKCVDTPKNVGHPLASRSKETKEVSHALAAPPRPTNPLANSLFGPMRRPESPEQRRAGLHAPLGLSALGR